MSEMKETTARFAFEDTARETARLLEVKIPEGIDLIAHPPRAEENVFFPSTYGDIPFKVKYRNFDCRTEDGMIVWYILVQDDRFNYDLFYPQETSVSPLHKKNYSGLPGVLKFPGKTESPSGSLEDPENSP